ncbi:MAG: MGMT family protein [Anaerolineales bacterium]|nr:MGMT family protein [Anaerolineales bacterium]
MTPFFLLSPGFDGVQTQSVGVVKRIPPGNVATYGQVAALVQLPAGVAPRITAPWGRAGLGRRWLAARPACPGSG